MSEIKPVAPYKEVTFKGRVFKRTGISPARAALERQKTSLAPGDPGTDENPIMRDGYPYVYSSTGKLVRMLEFDPETMEIYILKPGEGLSNDQKEMLKRAKEMPVVYDEDCPKSSLESLERMRQYGMARNKKWRESKAVQ